MAVFDASVHFEDGTEATVVGINFAKPRLKDAIAWEASPQFAATKTAGIGTAGVAFYIWRRLLRESPELAGATFEEFLERAEGYELAEQKPADPMVGDGEPDPPTAPPTPA